MKKFTILLLAAVLITACNNSGVPEKPPEDSPVITTPATATTAATTPQVATTSFQPRPPIPTTPPVTAKTPPVTSKTPPVTATTPPVTTISEFNFDSNTPLFETVSNEDVRDMLDLIHGRTVYRFKDEFSDINDVPLDIFLTFIWARTRVVRSVFIPDEIILGEECTVDNADCTVGYSCDLFYKPETVESIIKTYFNPNFSIRGYDFNEYSTDYWWWEWYAERGLFEFSGYTGPVRDVITQSFPIVEDACLVDEFYHVKIVEADLSHRFAGDFRGIHIGGDEIGTFLYDEHHWEYAIEWWKLNIFAPEWLILNETFNDAPRYLYTFKRNEQGLMNIYSRELVS